MKINFLASVLCASALFGPAITTQAQNVYYPADATISASITADNVIVGYANQSDYFGAVNGTNPVVNVIPGAALSGAISYFNSSSGAISGGSFGDDVFAYDSSSITITGGSIPGYFIETNAVINFFGTGFTANLVDPNARGNSLYSLSGTLSDGTVLSNVSLYIGNNSNARYTFNSPAGSSVPEPGSVALFLGLGLSGAGFLTRRRLRLRCSA